MKRNVKNLIGYTMGATDGEIGKVKEFYFDDDNWTIRYLVVKTGNWLSGRLVLISPEALLTADWHNEVFPVNLTKEQIKNSPDIDTEQPVSRQQEIKLYEHYSWRNYWGGGLWLGGMGTSGMMLPVQEPFEEKLNNYNNPAGMEPGGDPALRSTAKVKGYSIHAADGDIGEIEDFIIDDSNWKLDFMVIDTGNWFPGKKVLISPEWIKKIKWATSEVVVNATVEHVKNSPEYDPAMPISPWYIEGLHKYYNSLAIHEQ